MEPTEDPQRHDMIVRLRRIEGQLRGIQRMVEQEETCEDVARQLCAARRALDRAFYEMIACSIERELGETRKGPKRAHEVVSNVASILAKYG